MSLTNTEQLTLQNKVVNKEKWTKELASISEQKNKLVTTRDLVKKQFELQIANDEAAVSKGGYVLLKPTWQFELDPEYRERHRQITIIGHTLKKIQFQASLAEHELNIKNTQTQYDTLKAQLDKLCSEIESLEKKGE